MNCSQNTFDIAEHIVVPESKHAIAFFRQTTISHNIRGRFIVLATVDFNHQASFAAHKIADVARNRFLSYEFMPVDLPVADAIPENRLFD